MDEKLSITNQKCDNVEYDDDDTTHADGHMILMCWLCDSKSGYVYLRKGQQCNEYIYMGSSTLYRIIYCHYTVLGF